MKRSLKIAPTGEYTEPIWYPPVGGYISGLVVMRPYDYRVNSILGFTCFSRMV